MREVAAGILVLAIGWGTTYSPKPEPTRGNFNPTVILDTSCCILIEEPTLREKVQEEIRTLLDNTP